MTSRRRTTLALLVLLGAGCRGEDDPGIRGTSRHIELVSWSEFEPCASTLPQLDAFIDAVFVALEEPAPDGVFIELNWFTDTDLAEHPGAWPCLTQSQGCTLDGDPRIHIASRDIEHYHELVHAVHLTALGPSHRFLHEGLATYYGEPLRDAGLDTTDLAQRIEGALDLSGDFAIEDYPIARRFVGATIERWGIAAFKDFWAALPADATVDEFRAVYEASYGEAFDDAVAAIAVHSTRTLMLTRCLDDPAPWSAADRFEIEIGGVCADQGSIGPAILDPTAFERRFVLEIPVDGYYRIRATGGALEQTVLHALSCEGVATPQAWSVTRDLDDIRELGAGRYLTSVGLADDMADQRVKVEVQPYP